MRDGSAERRLPLGSLRIDMDELKVLGDVRESIDLLLINGMPLRDAEFLAARVVLG